MSAISARVVVADDHPVVLRGVCSLLETESDFQVVETCTSGTAALAAILKHRPDVALLDLSMPGISGLGVMEALRTEDVECRVMLLSASMLDRDVHAAIRLGVSGLVLKDSAPDTLILALREVLSGGRWLPADLVAGAIAREVERKRAGDRIAGQLTPREREICLLLGNDLSNKEIARLLDISDATVKLHLHNIYQKLNVNNRRKLIQIAGDHADSLSV